MKVRTCAFLAIVASGCTTPGLFAKETVGEKFRQVLSEIDARCRADKIGPYLDPGDPEYRRKRRATDCDILTLEPRDWRTAKMVKLDSQAYPVPELWLATPDGKFAHSIKLPASVDLESEDFSKASGDKIFQRLCERFAGERILAKATEVEGVVQARALQSRPRGYLNLAFWTAEKGDTGNIPQDYFVQPPLGRYDFLEVLKIDPVSKVKQWVRFERGSATTSKRTISADVGNGKAASIPYVVVERTISEPSAKFAFTWRGVWPTGALEFGIEGAEFIVYRIAPFEVMALRRTFMKHGPYPGHSDRRMTWTDHCDAEKNMRAPHVLVPALLEPKNSK